jgi:hypothetical protein
MITPIPTASQALIEAQQLRSYFSDFKTRLESCQSLRAVNALNFTELWQKASELRDLQTRVTNVYRSTQGGILNVTSSDQLDAISQQLSQASIFVQNIEDLQTSAFSLPEIENVFENTLTAPSNSSEHTSSNREIMARQDEEYRIASFQDQLARFQNQFTNLKQEPKELELPQNFNNLLEFHKSVKEYAQKTICATKSHQESIEKLLQQIETRINQLISSQTKIESMREQKTQSPQGACVHYKKLKEALEQVSQLSQPSSQELMEKNNNVKKALQEFSTEEKIRLLDTLSTVLIREKARPKAIPHTLLSHDISMWGGSIKQKIQALDEILKELAPQPSGEQSKKDSTIMQESWEAAKVVTIQPPTQLNRTPPRSSSSTQVNPHFFQKIDQLQKIVNLLEANNSMNNFNDAIQLLILLESENVKIPFAITSAEPQETVNRSCFHLHHIHKSEHSEKPGADKNYGESAMKGINYFANNEERCRAFRRTMTELALKGLEEAICAAQTDTIRIMLEVLEKMPMNSKDLPESTQNLAHSLFGHMYHFHCEERKKNLTLADPQSDSDFGRHAFCCPAGQVDPGTKAQAVQKLREDLKTAWKI